MKVYLAGKIRGLPQFGREAFRKGAAELRSAGHEVFCPAENTERLYGAAVYEADHGDEEAAGIDRRLVFGLDLDWICRHAEVVALLPGWETSPGATAERAVALALDLQIWELA